MASRLRVECAKFPDHIKLGYRMIQLIGHGHCTSKIAFTGKAFGDGSQSSLHIRINLR